MTLFVKTITEPSVANLAATKAKTIYGYLRSGLNENECFKQYDISFANSKKVMDEIKRLESDISSKMGDSKITKTVLLESLKSKLLDVEVVLDDVIAYSDGDPDNSPTRTVYKESFISND